MQSNTFVPVEALHQQSKTKIWKDSIFIPSYLLEGFSDAGLQENWQNGEVVDKDDLRLAINTHGGQIVLGAHSRVVVHHDGLMIQTLEEE